MASKWVVPVRAKASLTSGSISSRWPSSKAAASGAIDGSSRSNSRARLQCRESPQPAGEHVRSVPLGVTPEALRIVDGQPQADSLRLQERAIVELARIERSGDLASCPAASTACPARISRRSPVTITIARPEAGASAGRR